LGTPRTKSLARAIQLLGTVASHPAGASASELARLTRLPRSTVARTLRTLADFGLVEEGEEKGGWVLGYELVRLARAADPHRRLVQVARPALSRLRDVTGESALLAVPRGRPGMEILLQLDGRRHVGVANWVGADVPLHASSAGKLVLADLDEEELEAWLDGQRLVAFTDRTITEARALCAELARVRRLGSAELVDELEAGLASVSVPARSARGALVGMIGISGPTFRLSKTRRRDLLPTVQATAAEIEHALTR
jgi:DNA-binding IclR family transcriptional regulator